MHQTNRLFIRSQLSSTPPLPAHFPVNKYLKSIYGKVALDPEKGSPDRAKPYILTVVLGNLYRGIIPPEHGRPLFKVQGASPEIALQRLDEKLHSLRKHGAGQVFRLTAQDEKDVHQVRARLQELKLGEVEIAMLLGGGLRVLEINQKHGLDPYNDDIIKWGEEEAVRRETPLGNAAALFQTLIPPPIRRPLIDDHDQRSVVRSILNHLIQKFGTDTPFISVLENTKGLREYALEFLHREEGGTLTTRRKRHQILVRFFNVMCPHLRMPSPVALIFGTKPRGVAQAIVAPDPEAIERVLRYQLRKRPDMLLYTILQVFAGLRPEEAYRFLFLARELIIDNSRIVLTKEITKTGVTRVIHARPAFVAWLKLVPRWSDPNFDLVSRGRDGEPIGPNGLQSMLNHQLRRIGRWKGKIPKESLRKSWISACVAVGIPKEPFIIVEAGHTSIATSIKHYDAKWTKAMGLALFSIFPQQPTVVPEEWDLVHAYDQRKEVA
jgi:integrase